MSRLPEPLVTLNESLKQLSSEPGFANCQQVVNSVVNLLGIESQGDWKLFTDSQGKIRSNGTWFMLAEGFADRRAAYKVSEDNRANIDFKVYWMKNASKSVVSWLTALTPNFEDEPFYGKKNIGIDFIIPEAADKVVVVLSHHYVIRILELQGALRSTQLTVLNKWLADFDFENKAQVHNILWDSFDLEPVNKDFYKGISTFFVQLKQHLADKGILDDKHAAIFANRLIGRIVFCWFLDRKGIINPEMKYFDPEGAKATEYYHSKLETLFFRVFNTPKDERSGGWRKGQKRLFPETDPKDLFNANIDLVTPFLNGGLFEEKDDEVGIRFKLDFPKNYFDELYTFFRHYNFTTDESSSTFQQVAIDPEMLGRIFENLLAEQIEETGEQARKAKGAFYTPREIVDHMCKESLRDYLKSKISETEDRDRRLGQLLDSKAHEFRDQQTNYKRDLKPYKSDIIEALDNLKVIDPACGSGAFPMGMLQLLLQCYERIEPRFDSYKSKLTIIKNNLYGVDIEPMAVEISRLRAWLSIVVDESADVKPLPNLDFKFVCANSLIPVPGDQDMTLALDPFFSNLENEIEQYFLASDHEDKESLKIEITKLIDAKVREKLRHITKLGVSHPDKQLNEYLRKKNKKALEKNVELMNLWSSYPNIFATDEPVGFFEPRYFFPSAKGSFDIVIANPPYGADIDDKIDTYAELYPETSKYYKDSYKLFINVGIESLCKPYGVLVYIVPNTLLLQPRYRDARKFLLKYKLLQIINLGENVFEQVVVPTCVILVQKDKPGGQLTFIDLAEKSKYSGSLVAKDTQVIDQSLYSKTKHNLFTIHVRTLQSDEKPLEEVFEAKDGGIKYQRVKVGLSQKGKNDLAERLFYEGEQKHKSDIQFFAGKHINRAGWIINKNNLKWLRHNYKTILKSNEKVYWNKSLFEAKDKLVWRQTSPYFVGAWLPDQMPFANTVQAGFVRPRYKKHINTKYVLGLLNSNYLRYLYSQSVQEEGRVFPQVKLSKLNSLPIRMIRVEDQVPIISLVEEISSTMATNAEADIAPLVQKMDKLVYAIYDLTPEEVAVVEGHFKQT